MTITEMRRAIDAARHLLVQIRRRHPPFAGYLVLADRSGQVEIDVTLRWMIESFPAGFIANPAFDEAQRIIEQLAEASDQEQAQLEARLQELDLRVRDDLQIEIRFGPTVKGDDLSVAERGGLDYELIAALQQDPQVDHQLIPQTPTSIRIVLGTLSSLTPIQ